GFELRIKAELTPARALVIEQPPERRGLDRLGGFFREIEERRRSFARGNEAERGGRGESVGVGKRFCGGARREIADGGRRREPPDEVRVGRSPFQRVFFRLCSSEGGGDFDFFSDAADAPRFEIGAVLAVIAASQLEQQ